MDAMKIKLVIIVGGNLLIGVLLVMSGSQAYLPKKVN